MTPYSQQDQQWAGVKMNGTTSTIGRYGCLVTCLGIVTDMTPDKVNDSLSKNDGYSNDLVLWSGVPKSLSLDLISSPQAYDNAKVLDVIAREGFCIVEVDSDGTIATTADTHWIVYTGNHQCIDPWDGGTKPTAAYPIAKMYVDFHKTPVVVPPTPPQSPITDQTLLPILDPVGKPMEVQQARSEIYDGRRNIADLKNQQINLNQQVTNLNQVIQTQDQELKDTLVKIAPRPPSLKWAFDYLFS